MFTAGIRRCFKSLAADFEAHDVFFKFQEEDKDKKGLLKSRCLYISLESICDLWFTPRDFRTFCQVLESLLDDNDMYESTHFIVISLIYNIFVLTESFKYS